MELNCHDLADRIKINISSLEELWSGQLLSKGGLVLEHLEPQPVSRCVSSAKS